MQPLYPFSNPGAPVQRAARVTHSPHECARRGAQPSLGPAACRRPNGGLGLASSRRLAAPRGASGRFVVLNKRPLAPRRDTTAHFLFPRDTKKEMGLRLPPAPW